MKVRDIVEVFKLNIISGEEWLDNEFASFYASDILSCVISSAKEGSVWITQQTHKNIMAVAVLKKISAVILVNGVLPEEEVVEISNREEIPILGTSDDTFLISGKFYRHFYE